MIEKQQQIAENVPSCNYCAATIVARPLQTTVKGKKPAFRIRKKSRSTGLIQRIQESGRVSGRKILLTHMNFIILSCPDLNLVDIWISFDKDEVLRVGGGGRVDPSSMEMMIFIY